MLSNVNLHLIKVKGKPPTWSSAVSPWSSNNPWKYSWMSHQLSNLKKHKRTNHVTWTFDLDTKMSTNHTDLLRRLQWLCPVCLGAPSRPARTVWTARICLEWRTSSEAARAALRSRPTPARLQAPAQPPEPKQMQSFRFERCSQTSNTVRYVMYNMTLLLAKIL